MPTPFDEGTDQSASLFVTDRLPCQTDPGSCSDRPP